MNPRFYKTEVGDCELIALSDGGLNYSASMIFGNVPKEEASELGLPERQVLIPYTILLIRTADRALLVDVGAGDFGNRGDEFFPGLLDIRGFHRNKSRSATRTHGAPHSRCKEGVWGVGRTA